MKPVGNPLGRLLEAADIAHLERELELLTGVASRVAVRPAVPAHQLKRKKGAEDEEIEIPPPLKTEGESWLTARHACDPDALVEAAFEDAVLAAGEEDDGEPEPAFAAADLREALRAFSGFPKSLKAPPLPKRRRAGAGSVGAAPPIPASAASQSEEAFQATSAPPPVPQPGAAPPPVPTGAASDTERGVKAWFEEFFDDDYLATLPFESEAATAKEAHFIETKLDRSAGARLLDIGSGYGRVALELASSGYQITGLDISLPLLLQAGETARQLGLNIDFLQEDMRDMSFDGVFDGAYCVNTSFGYFEDLTNSAVIERIYAALKPGGRFFLEVINRDFIISDLPSRIWWEGEDCVVMDEVDFNFLTSRVVSTRSMAFSDGRSPKARISVRAYCLHEIAVLLESSGFKVLDVTGNTGTDGRFFGQQSPYIIVTAEKPAGNKK